MKQKKALFMCNAPNKAGQENTFIVHHSSSSICCKTPLITITSASATVLPTEHVKQKTPFILCICTEHGRVLGVLAWELGQCILQGYKYNVVMFIGIELCPNGNALGTLIPALLDLCFIQPTLHYWPKRLLFGQYCYWSGCRGFFFRRYGWHALQQNLAIASSSNFLCLFSNSRRSADRTNKWPLRMTLMCDLDLSVLSYFEQWLCSCWTKHLQIFTECSLGYGHSSDAKISLAICNEFHLRVHYVFHHFMKMCLWP